MGTEFTPIISALGGALIGLAAVMLMALNGRIFGATGILAGLMTPQSSSDFSWRLALVAGMVSAPMVYWLVAGSSVDVTIVSGPVTTVLGGLIVGIGVTFGTGCTSGHGVCGISRLSRRSIVATLTFMLTTAITVYVIRHMFGGTLV